MRKNVFTSIGAVLLLTAGLVIYSSCKKNASAPTGQNTTEAKAYDNSLKPLTNNPQQNEDQTFAAQVLNVNDNGDGSFDVALNRHELMFTTSDAALKDFLTDAMRSNKTLKITANPWSGVINGASVYTTGTANTGLTSGNPVNIDLTSVSDEKLNNLNENNPVFSQMPINITEGNLAAAIPDMATAQTIFNYFASQCCALGGPFSIDYCMSFQYCQDGCYARAHKMCWILNNKYHYATQKIFSFANSGSDKLCVQAQKWGGCCIRWWYHVAPLVTINTPTGQKAYVFDPAMFDAPVPLATWLHAQENPVCQPTGSRAHVSMIAIQPTASYSPANYAGTRFDTDPVYADTDTTMVHYRPLASCP